MKAVRFVKAFAPGNVSCLFRVHPHKNPRWRGSYGLGFTVNEGVTVTASLGEKTEVFFNKRMILFPTVLFVIRKLTPKNVHVEIESPLPIGSGFGISGASALATAYAVNKLFGLGKTKKELAILAHTADASEATGLGDVVNQYFGGFLLKTVSSAQFKVQRVPLSAEAVYYKVLSDLSTKGVLSDAKLIAAIDKASDDAMKKVCVLLAEKNATLGKLLDVAYDFVKTSGLLKDSKTEVIIEKIRRNGGHASMIVVGNAVMSDKPFLGAKKLGISKNNAQLL